MFTEAHELHADCPGLYTLFDNTGSFPGHNVSSQSECDKNNSDKSSINVDVCSFYESLSRAQNLYLVGSDYLRSGYDYHGLKGLLAYLVG